LNNHKFIAKIIACKKNHRRSQTTSNQIILNQLDFQAVPVLVGQDHGGLEDHVVGHGDLGENEVGHGRVDHGSPWVVHTTVLGNLHMMVRDCSRMVRTLALVYNHNHCIHRMLVVARGIHRMWGARGIHRMWGARGIHRMLGVRGIHRMLGARGIHRMWEARGIHRMWVARGILVEGILAGGIHRNLAGGIRHILGCIHHRIHPFLGNLEGHKD